MRKVIHRQSKRFQAAKKLVEAKKTYSIEEAVDLIKKTSTVKFDASVDVHVLLGIDTKKGEQQVRSSVVLPYGTGKTIKVAAVASDINQQKAAKEAGADLIGEKELIEEIKGGKINFDVLVASPEAMKLLAPVAKILGPKGLMPNPKDGTIAANLKEAVENLKKGKVTFKNDDSGNLHISLGRVSFEKEKLIANFRAAMEAVLKAKPNSAKGVYLKSVTLASSMGPGIKVSI